MGGFTDIVFYDKEDEKVISYRTGFSVYEEKFECGMLTAEGRNAAGFMLNVQDDIPSRFGRNRFSQPQSFDFLADGYSLNGTWKFISFNKENRTLENGKTVLFASITLESTRKPVTVEICTILDGTEVLERYYTIHNNGTSPLAVSDITVAGGGLEIRHDWDKYGNNADYNKIYSLGYPEECHWGHEGAFRFHPLKRDGTFIAGRYLCDRYRHPMFIIRNNQTGSLFNCQLAFTGGYKFCLFLDICGSDALLSWKAMTDGVNPFIVLGGGESYTVPSVHIGYTQGDLDNSVNTMHRHLRNTVFTAPKPRGLCGIVSGGMGPERVMDMTAIRHAADTFALAGAETLIIDAGWYCRAGDEVHEWHNYMSNWTPDAGKHPDGLKEAADYIHSKGLLFGLWLDIESAGRKSDIYNNHPDYMLKDRYGNKTTILDMTQPAVAAWAENALADVISRYGVDLFRLDNNIDYRSFHSVVGENAEGVYSRYYKAVYEMYDRLHRRFPDVLFENCAGGGGRTDLGLVKHFNHSWVSDWQKLPRAVAITNGMTMCLPPEYVDRLFAGMDSHISGSLEMILRHTLFGKPTINLLSPVGASINIDQLDFVKHTIALYNKHIRPFAADGLIYHHTPELQGEETIGDCILERSAPDRTESVIGIFRLGNQPENEYVTVYPRGITPSGEYSVYYDNARATDRRSGFQLLNNGIRVRLANALSSEIIVLKKEGE